LLADAGMENARDLAFDDDPELAIAMLMKVMPVIRETDAVHQHQYLAQLEVLGDVLAESGAYNHAAMAYAAGKNLARDLDVNPDIFISKRTVVQAKANRKVRAIAADQAELGQAMNRAEASTTTPRGK
jgi:hypothetical protein